MQKTSLFKMPQIKINPVSDEDKENINPNVYVQKKRKQLPLRRDIFKDITQETHFLSQMETLLSTR